MAMAEHSQDSPNVISCPPLVFAGALALGFLLNWLFPMRSFSSQRLQLLGGLVSFAGTAIGLWGVWALHRAGTNVRPDRPVTALVTNGPFRYSRNPLYLAMTLVCSGIALYTGTVWLLATLVPAVAGVHWKIVRREEQFLERRFGDDYRAYKAQVHRWI